VNSLPEVISMHPMVPGIAEKAARLHSTGGGVCKHGMVVQALRRLVTALGEDRLQDVAEQRDAATNLCCKTVARRDVISRDMSSYRAKSTFIGSTVYHFTMPFLPPPFTIDVALTNTAAWTLPPAVASAHRHWSYNTTQPNSGPDSPHVICRRTDNTV
jgi:hypothetical protein